MSCFFFQAEDGIRDIGVTGVQTCALPISRPGRRSHRLTRLAVAAISAESRPRSRTRTTPDGGRVRASTDAAAAALAPTPAIDRKSVGEGKSVGLGGRRIIKKKKPNQTHTR